MLSSAGETRMVAACEGTPSHLQRISYIDKKSRFCARAPFYIAIVRIFLARALTVFGAGLLSEIIRYTSSRDALPFKEKTT